MKTPAKTWLIVVALALLLACLVWLISRPGGRGGAGVSEASRGPSFEVLVVKPRIARPLFGILPTALEEKLEAGSERRFDHTNRGARAGSVEHNRVELRADDWELVIEADGEGGIAPGTRLVYTMMLAERRRTLRCRPADAANGYLRTAARAGAGELDGDFHAELATCEDVETGRVIKWPPAPLTVRGSFAGLPHGRR